MVKNCYIHNPSLWCTCKRMYIIKYIVHRYEHSDCGGSLSGWTSTRCVYDTTCQLHLLWNVCYQTLELLQVSQYWSYVHREAIQLHGVCVKIMIRVFD